MKHKGFSLTGFLGEEYLEPEETKEKRFFLEMDDKKFFIDKSKVIIGRSEECDIVIEGDDYVSRKHAVISVILDECILEDISSSGTYLGSMEDGKPVVKRLGSEMPYSVKLVDGQLIRIGMKILTFRVMEC